VLTPEFTFNIERTNAFPLLPSRLPLPARDSPLFFGWWGKKPPAGDAPVSLYKQPLTLLFRQTLPRRRSNKPFSAVGPFHAEASGAPFFPRPPGLPPPQTFLVHSHRVTAPLLIRETSESTSLLEAYLLRECRRRGFASLT